MTISSSINKAQYTANGGTTVFAYNFLIPSSQDIQVFLGDALQSSGFTVSGYGNPAGGSVTFTTAPASGVIVTILRVMPLTQVVDYVPYDAFPAQTHEGALDKLTMIDQQLQEQIDRALKLPVESTITDIEVSGAVDNALVEFDTTTKPGTLILTSGPTASEIQADVDSAAASAASAAGSASAAAGSAASAAASADAAEEAANNLTANKYEETTTVVKSVFTIPFAINTMAPNVMIMVNGVVQPPSAYTITNSNTITLDEAVPIGTNFYLAAAAPPTLPNFTDIVRTSAPATLGQDLISNGGGLWVPTYPRHKNFFINGGMNVQQRPELSGLTDVNIRYCKADRWCVQVAGTGISYSITAGDFGGVATGQALYIAGLNMTGYTRISQRIEALNCQPLTNKRITVSGVCYHDFGIDTVFGIVLEKPTAKDDFTAVTTIQNGPGVTVPSGVPTIVSFNLFLAEEAKNGLMVSFQPFENRTVVNKTVALAEAQLELGDIKTPFEHRQFGEELFLCQRYFEKSYGQGIAIGALTNVDEEVIWAVKTDANYYFPVPFKVEKRIDVTYFQFYSPSTGDAGKVRHNTAGVDITGTNAVSGKRSIIGSISATDQNMYSYHWTANAEL